jgi:F0F1-type ATP synthase assembly protein I
VTELFCLKAGYVRKNDHSIRVDKKQDDKYSNYRQIGILTTIPMLMAVGPILGYYIGDFLDQKLGTAPYLMVVFIFLGFAAAGKGVYNLIKRASQVK